MSLWLPDWPLTVHARTHGAPPEDTPFALVERGPRGVVLTAVNAAARARGLRVGQRHADAQAIEPRLSTGPARRDDDAAALAALAHWCLRWSPGVAVDAPDGVLIDTGGSAHLFGGEAGLLADIAARLASAGIAARAAAAPTPGAAWACARFSGLTQVEDTRAACAALPLPALRLAPGVLAAAGSLGFRRIGDLYAMPRAGLARRFRDATGLSIVERLDQLTGDAPEALATIEPPAAHVARAAFAEPVTDTNGIVRHLPGLLDRLAVSLAGAGLGALLLRLAGCRIDGTVTAIEVRLGAAARDPALWRRLLGERGLERLDLGFGIDALVLAAVETGAVEATSRVLGEAESTREPLPGLIDRLAARLGPDAVRVARPRARWLPEHAERWVPAQGRAIDCGGPADPAGALRPLLLLDPPEPVEATALVPHGAPLQFRWRRVVRRVARVEGPERLAAEWWRRQARTRDYYRVEDVDGARFWLFREGLYDTGETQDAGPPTWWLHGLFA